MVHALRAEVVAEGIETPEIRAALLERGFSYGQGHCFGMPLGADRGGQ